MTTVLRTSCLFLVALAASTGARAQSGPTQTGSVTVTGFADRICVLGTPQVDLSGSTNIGQISGSTVRIANLSDEQDLTTKATDFDITMAAVCNFNHRVVLSSDRGGLWRVTASGPHAGFADGVPYLATINWADLNDSLMAPASSLGEVERIMTVDRPAFGDLIVHVRIDQGATNQGAGAPLVAGAYEDILRITVGAQ